MYEINEENDSFQRLSPEDLQMGYLEYLDIILQKIYDKEIEVVHIKKRSRPL